MTKPTGRPRGRPKTKEYVTLMARVDVALADQARQYARVHRQTISDVLRDGLQVLLSEQDPWHPLTSDRNAGPENLSDSKAAHADIASDTKEGLAAMVSDENGGVTEKVADAPRDTAKVSDMNAAPATTTYDPDAAYARMQALQGQGMSLAAIAEQLTAEGVPTKQGRGWHRSSVNYLLKTHGKTHGR